MNRHCVPQFNPIQRSSIQRVYILKILIWSAEMLSQALMLTVLLIILAHVDSPATAEDVIVLSLSVLIFFGLSGYALTTLCARLFWAPLNCWRYPAVACVLFPIHFGLLSLLSSNGFMDPMSRIAFLGVGTLIVGSTTLLGSSLLARMVEK